MSTSRRTLGASYHPGGTGTSPSLRRARKPFRLGNAAIGISLLAFTIGVYTYSIAAVKQDDFSDVEDLLPPLAERAGLRSIEDEERDLLPPNTLQSNDRSVPQTSSPSALSPGIPLDPNTNNMHNTAGTASTIGANMGQGGEGGWKSWALPRRLSDITWVRNSGLVEKGTGNVLVWGAPNVDNIGSISDRTKGPRLV